MKITVKALLVNISSEYQEKIDELMSAFSSAKRFAYKRLLEDEIKKGEIEKLISQKYGLNIRQSKDAVESARQLIVSQKVLIKDYYENQTKKIKTIENKINRSKSKKNTEALSKKLKERQIKQSAYKDHIDNDTIPKIIFGGRENFIKRCKGLITNKEWKDLRDNNYYSRGDKTRKGNPNLRIIDDEGLTFLEISTLDRIGSNRAVKIKVPLYLPWKLSKKTGKVNGRNYRQMILDYLQTEEAYRVELIRRNGKIYCHITIDESKISEYTEEHNISNGIIGIDANPDGLALTKLDKHGNYKWSTYLKRSELMYARANKRENICGELVKQAISIVKSEKCAISFEDLKFKNDIGMAIKFDRIKNQSIYSRLLTILETQAKREGIQSFKVKPQFASKIGLYKYCHQYGLNTHNGSALVIGRRAFKFNEKVPKLLKDKLLTQEEKYQFSEQNNWKQWSIINKKIKLKGGEDPGFWLKHRRLILNIS